MRHLKKLLMLWFCVFLITGCSKPENNGKVISSGNSVDKGISNQMETADKTTEKGVDYDLTQMSSDMVYATVYQMMAAPQQYEGKKFRIDGNFYAAYYEKTNKYYYYCIVQDATACCAQGLEFIWGDGTHVYPDEYPKDNAEVIVEGTFETYREDGDKNLYCRLCNATMQVEK